MRSFTTFFPLITLLSLSLLSGSPLTASPLIPGEYLVLRGGGTLIITARKKGQYFKINTYGANGHSCFVDGIIENNKNVQKPYEGAPDCTITFTPKDSSIEISGSSSDDGQTCQGFCGARAQFTHEYFKPDEICYAKEKNKNLKLFKSYYSKKTYDLAEKTLRKVYDSCKRFMGTVQELEIVNDLAVTYKNLNKKDDCLNVIKPFDEIADMNESDIKSNYPPADAETIAPLAKKLKFNRELCRKLE